jgi:outer membrane protein, heavy metal efflux system
MHKKAVLLFFALCLPLAASAQGPSEESTLTLSEVLRETFANNPAVHSAAHTVAAQRRKVPQARALPDPQVTVGWMGNATPFSVMAGDPSSYRGFGAMQTLPYPGKLKLRGEMASKDVQAAQADYESVRRRLAAQAKATFYEYSFYDKALQVAFKNKDLLEKLSQISESRYRVGKAMQQDVLKSHTEISLLLQKITVLQQQRATAQARLNVLMARSPDSPLPPAAEVALTPFSRTLEELYQVAATNNPALQRDQAMVERNQVAVDLAHKEYRPDLSVAFMYQQRDDQPDMKGATFTVNIPVFYRGKQREALRQAQEEVISAEKGKEDRLNETRFELKQSYLAAKAAKDLADLYTKAVIPQASLALDSSMSAYQVGSGDFLAVFSNFSTLINYETDYYRQVADYQMALANIESLTGVEFAPVEADAENPHSHPESPASAVVIPGVKKAVTK